MKKSEIPFYGRSDTKGAKKEIKQYNKVNKSVFKRGY